LLDIPDELIELKPLGLKLRHQGSCHFDSEVYRHANLGILVVQRSATFGALR